MLYCNKDSLSKQWYRIDCPETNPGICTLNHWKKKTKEKKLSRTKQTFSTILLGNLLFTENIGSDPFLTPCTEYFNIRPKFIKYIGEK